VQRRADNRRTGVLAMCISSCISQRVEATDWVKQMNTCAEPRCAVSSSTRVAYQQTCLL